jgi:hypothetical protein
MDQLRKDQVIMDCQEFKSQMMDWVLKEAPVESSRNLELHAAGCHVCGSLLEKALHARDVLLGWQDEEIPESIMFTPARSNFWGWLQAAPRWANAMAAVAAAGVLIFGILSLARTELRYDHGNFSLAFGHAPVSMTVPAQPMGTSLVNAGLSSAEIEKMVSAKYTSLSGQDREQYAAQLERLSQQWQVQRAGDLQKIGNSFDQVKTVMWKEMQRNNAIVQYAARQIATSSKN